MTERTAGISVTELNRIIGEALRKEPRIRSVTVTAEISGFKHHLASGHWYFSLKDAESAIPCAMFRQNNIRTRIRPKDGMLVTVNGYVEIYTRDGRVSLYVTDMRPAGTGSLYEQYEELRRKLAAEGLFDQGRKRLLPQVPRKVAVITSASGAALHDILNVSGMRNPGIPIVIVPSAVQGAGAGGQIAAAIRKACRIKDVDVIILARGGGSLEDLWCCNEEIVARAVAESPIPIVTGIGHETDSPIADFAADVRASTPSNAAEIVFPDRRELTGRVNLVRNRLCRAMTARTDRARILLQDRRARLIRLSPERRMLMLTDVAHRAEQRMHQAMNLRMSRQEELIRNGQLRLSFAMNRLITGAEHRLARERSRAGAISPLRVLDRGYALVYDREGRMIYGAKEAEHVPEMKIRFRDGETDVIRKGEAKSAEANAGIR